MALRTRHERIADLIGDGLIELRFLSAHFQMNLFVQFFAKGPHHARQFSEHFLIGSMRVFIGQLQVGRHQVELREGFAQHRTCGSDSCCCSNCVPILINRFPPKDQLPDQIHHAVEPFVSTRMVASSPTGFGCLSCLCRA